MRQTHLRSRWNTAGAVLVLVIFLGLATAWAQTPKSVVIGSNPPGTVFYALASGLAKVVSGAAPFPMTVQTYTGTSTFIPLVNNGELDFGINNAVDMALTYRGPNFKIFGRNPFPHTPNLRLMMRGAPLMIAPAVRKDSPIKTIHDVKGKRVTGEYPAHLAVWYNASGILANAGLTWEDVRVVPVPAANEGVDALVQGRADVAFHAVGSAKIKEADAAVGLRHPLLDCTPQGEERLKRAVPGYYLASLKAGSFTAILEDTCVEAYDIYVVTHKALPDAVVQAALKAIWENIDKLPPLHPIFKQWTRERGVDSGVTLPYHPGAIRFYKEREAWKPEMDQAQQKLLALNP